MNIIEAIKSGKRFRRRGQPRYLELFHDIDLCLSAVDITADDWEVEEKKVMITEAAFEAAWDRAVERGKTYSPRESAYFFKGFLAKELGL